MKTENDLDALIAALPKELNPERDLWPELEARLEPKWQVTTAKNPLESLLLKFKPYLSFAPHLWQSASVASVLVGVLFLGSQMFDDKVLLASSSLEQRALAMQLHYEHAKATQLLGLNEIHPAFEDWQVQMGILESAIKQVLEAVSQSPESDFLLGQLRFLYEQQQNFLQKVVQSGQI